MFKFKKIFIITGVGVVVVTGVYLGYKYVKNNLKITTGSEANIEKPDWFKTAKEAKETMATVIPAQKPDFITDGNLRLRNGGDEEEIWTLLYEEPGKPAVIAYLTFNFRSKCDYGSGEQICNTKKLENNQKVNLEGLKNGQDVTVIKLKVL